VEFSFANLLKAGFHRGAFSFQLIFGSPGCRAIVAPFMDAVFCTAYSWRSAMAKYIYRGLVYPYSASRYLFILGFISILFLSCFVPIAGAAEVTLAWDANTESDLGGYHVYVGTSSGIYPTRIDAGKVTSFTVSNLIDGQNYYFVATAYDKNHNESGFSKEVVFHPLVIDTDGDGITDDDEINIYGSDPNNSDTDGDGINDGAELSYWGGNWNKDYDADGLINLLDPDSDNDGFDDGMEIAQGYDPADLNSKPPPVYPHPVNLAWDPNNEADLAGYKVYYGAASRNYSFNMDVGNHTSCAISGLEEGKTYYFAATAYDGSGNESGFSQEVVYNTVTNHPPNPPTQPTGPSNGFSANDYTFTTTASDPDGDELNFRFDWGNGNISDWGASSQSHAWSLADEYCIKAQAQDIHGAESTWSDCKPFQVNLKTYTITATSGEHGTIEPSGNISINHGEGQTFTIVPDEHHHITDVLVNGVSVGAVTTYTFNHVTSDSSITALFAVDTYTFTATAGENGSISPAGTIPVEHDGSLSFTIIPDTNYHVRDVRVDGQSVGAVTTYTLYNITADHTITADFAINTHAITASARQHGAISPTGIISVNHGSSLTFTISPDTGYFIADVTIDGVSVGAVNSYRFENIVRDQTITADFAPNIYSITATATGEGSISPSGETFVNFGESVTYNLTPAQNHHVDAVRVDGVSVGTVTSYTFSNVSANHTISTNFVIDTYDITASAEGNGTISPSGVTSVDHGGSLSFVITPDTNHHIDNVLVDGQSHGITSSYTFNNVVDPHNIQAFFAPDNKGPIADAGPDLSVPTGEVTYLNAEKSSDQGSPIASYQWEQLSGPEVYLSDSSSMISYFEAPFTESHSEILTFRLTVTDNQGLQASDTCKVTIMGDSGSSQKIPMETGEVNIDHNWKRVDFKKEYVDPVVIAKPISLNGSQPAVIRIREINQSGFQIRIQEWEYLDGWHVAENVGYIVIERGTYQLENGARLEAGNFGADRVDKYGTVTFGQTFEKLPVVIASITSFNGSKALIGRIKNIHKKNFQYTIQQQELGEKGHIEEAVSYIAWEPSTGNLGDISFEVAKTENSVNHEFHTLGFTRNFEATPVFLADMQTLNGEDTANLRFRNKTVDSVEVQIDEEQSADSETNHTFETAGYMLFSKTH
jgi:hypothetical protein